MSCPLEALALEDGTELLLVNGPSLFCLDPILEEDMVFSIADVKACGEKALERMKLSRVFLGARLGALSVAGNMTRIVKSIWGCASANWVDWCVKIEVISRELNYI